MKKSKIKKDAKKQTNLVQKVTRLRFLKSPFLLFPISNMASEGKTWMKVEKRSDIWLHLLVNRENKNIVKCTRPNRARLTS